ncbi:hypothetical protein PENDEC_c040G02104 [Penicillium decumbens]|uniref:Zn(2)-C6 fungal-type domain-containing protein n=1 Tax=Penicillium decumbens TaxID=69771 RepID=A0A1V6NSF2_PENDC|nr:hypothetical protein PENDEC_c040G02104 [Penicillium decumbens]
MTAVATAPVMSNRDPGTETGTEHSPSRFTAVNGRDSTASAAGANPTPGTTNSGGRDAPSGANENQDASPRENTSQSRRSSPTAHAHKRKRSGSGEPDLQDADGYGRGSISRPGEAPSASNGARSSSASEVEAASAAIASGRSDTNEPSQPPSSGPWSDYESRLINQAQRAQQIDPSDAQLADVLRREAQGQGQDLRSLSRPAQSANVQPAPSSAFPERSAVQVAPKRKRVFSNRTKTGCMTCRRRKKKCDEQHPACNNCTRGGFLCEGYSTRTSWQKPYSSKAPVPLQSKEGYPDLGGQYLPETAPPHERQPAVADHVESRKMKPIVLDESDRPGQQYNTSPTGTAPSHASWAKRAWPGPGSGHHSYLSEPVAKPDYREIPPIHELPRDGPPKPEYSVVPPIRELSHGSHSRPSMPMFQVGVEHRPLPSVTIDTNSPQAQARMALGIDNPLSNRTGAPADDTEKGKMTRGEFYRPFDIQLVEERDRCKCALSRFNNACNPIHGLSSKEQNRLLKEVLVPPSSSVNSPPNPSAPRLVGSIGQGTVVESPFRCHYGWNINLEADVMVSENCLFVDDGAIQIGSNTWIGPNVTLLTACASENLQHRRGPQTLYQAKPIIIEQDCYIGAGSTIFPGVRIGRGAVIEAGDMVKRDVAPYQLTRNRSSY